MSLPNMLTIIRLALVPVIGWFLLQGQFATAGIVFVIGALTDALDGYLARRLGQVTRLGQMLDPLADKALINVVTLACASLGLLPFWFALVVLARDMLILAGAGVSRVLRPDYELLPSLLGKASVAVQMLLLAIVLLPIAPAIQARAHADVLVLLATALTLLSAALYGLAWLRRGEPA